MLRIVKIATLGALIFLLALSIVWAGPDRHPIREKSPATAQKVDQVKTRPIVAETPVEQSKQRATGTVLVEPKPVKGAASAAYEVKWSSINVAGGRLTSPTYEAHSSTGQSTAGDMTSDNYDAGAGFWNGATPGEITCNCNISFGDVTCDAAVNPVDVVYMVNFVYKTQDARCIPEGWICPYEIGDVNCDAAVNPVDVVYYVNYVYKTQNAFCEPCID